MVRLLAVLLAVLVWAAPAQAKREHIVHFKGTPYQLDVFKIQGHRPGKTLMLIGGIQGNEPGGFLSADLYADMTLEKGNLIVVPRANFYSIMLNQRGPNGDMNRKFDKPARPDYEAQIVQTLKELIAESDFLLNLHDGSGFFRPKWISPRMNPMRYGQSIIADAETFVSPKTGKVIKLGEMARAVCKEINQAIDNPKYYFHFNNHRTMEPGSPHAEQRGSATFYALTQLGIPAFGIETSKDLPTIELKVRHHNLAINAFMKRLGIIPENPAVNLKRPKLRYVVLSINGGRPTVVANKETLTINRGDKVFISHIEANYERGISCDILGYGGINDTRKSFTITRPTSVIVRKDHLQCGWIRLNVKTGGAKRVAAAPPAVETNPTAQYFVVKVNGEERLVGSGLTLSLVKGDTLELLDAWTPSGRKGLFSLNFKGFVPPNAKNTGDDRRIKIHTGGGLMPRWSLDGRGRRFRVVAERGNTGYGEFYVQLTKPSLDYVIVKTGGDDKYAVAPGETLYLSRSETVQLVDLKANFDTSRGVSCRIKYDGRVIDLKKGQRVALKGILNAFNGGEKPELVVLRFDAPIGRIFLAPRPVSAESGLKEPAG